MKVFNKINGFALGLLLAFAAPVAHAQVFEQGKSIISLGYGIGNLNKALFSVYTDELNYKYSGTGPFFGKFEYGVSDKVGFGVSINHIGSKISYNTENGNGQMYESKINWKNTSVLARVNIHFSRSEKLDAYWGTGLGYRFGGWKYSDNNPNNSDDDFEFKTVIPFGFETTVGMRYFFTDNLGLYLEAGLAKAPIQFGLNVAF